MFRNRSFVAAYVLVCLLALTTYPTHSSGAEEKPKPQVLFTNVNIFDGKSDALAEGMSVLVEGNLIKKIVTGNIEADGATVIDGGGRTLMPGLIESHAHLSFAAALTAIVVRNAANVRFGSLADIRDADLGCLLHPKELTRSESASMSAKCHKQTSAAILRV